MSKRTAQLIKEFESLPDDEKREFAAAFWRLAVPYESGPIEDEEIGEAGRALFALLDEEEHVPRAR